MAKYCLLALSLIIIEGFRGSKVYMGNPTLQTLPSESKFWNYNCFLHTSTHIDDGGSVADFFIVLWCPTARIASLPVPTEPKKNLPQNAPSSMCERLNMSYCFVT